MEPGLSRISSRTRTIVGGALYITATLQYLGAQVVSAAAWDPPYDWLNNYISDLGNTACGSFQLPHGTPAFVCSPLYVLMNASFIISGVLIIAGTTLLWRSWPARKLSSAGLVLWLIAGVGKIGVGLAPENANLALHTAAALNIPIGSVPILLLSLAVVRERRALALAGFAAFILGALGTVLSISAQVTGPGYLLGLGVGGMERIAGYPANLWLVAVGVLAFFASTPATITRIRAGEPAPRRPAR